MRTTALGAKQPWPINIPVCSLSLGNVLGEIYSNKPRRESSLFQGLQGLSVETGLGVEAGRSPVFSCCSQVAELSSALLPHPRLVGGLEVGVGESQHKLVMNRSFLTSGSPEWREDFFVGCISQHKRRAVQFSSVTGSQSQTSECKETSSPEGRPPDLLFRSSHCILCHVL